MINFDRPGKAFIFLVLAVNQKITITKVQKWGNSLALRIPKAFTLEAQLKNDSFVELTMIESQIIITPVVAPKWSLEELLAGINKKNIHGEVSSGKAVGKELW